MLQSMSTRRLDDFTIAACDGGFAIAAFGCGLFDAPLWLTGLVAFAMLAYWSWSRRRVLNRLHGAVREFVPRSRFALQAAIPRSHSRSNAIRWW